MGKNQAYKAMQRSRVGSTSAGPEEIEDGMMDGSFHSPEWHAARLASLNTTHTVTWEEFKKKQKFLSLAVIYISVGLFYTTGISAFHAASLRNYFICIQARLEKEDELKKGEVEADKDRMMREYRAQLDAERAMKLSHGRNHLGVKSNHKKERKERDLKRKSSKKRKHRRRSSESSSSESFSESSSSDEERESKRSRSRSKRGKKEKKHKPRPKHSSSSSSEKEGGPLPLSKFFGSVKR